METSKRSDAIGQIDIRGLAAISATAELRSIGLAAESLNTTQSTLSRLIRRVETDLGVSLFRRGWSGTETTREGEAACRSASAILRSIDTAERKIFARRESRPSLIQGLTLTQLRTIATVCRLQSATLAAKELDVSQPSVSRTLGQVQQYFGLELFDRSQRGLDPLPPALHLSELFGRISGQIGALRTQIAQKDRSEILGRVSIGVLSFSGHNLVPQAFTRLSQKHPSIRLVYVPGTYPSLVRALQRAEIEGFIGIQRGENCPEGLTETLLLEEDYTIVARADHPAHARAKSIVDLKDEQWLVPPFGSPVRSYIENLFSSVGIQPLVQTCEIQFFTAVEEMIARSDSIGIQTYSRSELRRMRPDLKKVDVPLQAPPAKIGLTTLSEAPDSPAFEEFRDVLAELSSDFS